MSKIAFIYPGQGAQSAGMGKDFYEKSSIARELFDSASDAIHLDLKKLCFEENELLDKTEYTQAAMVTVCLAMTRVAENMGLCPDITAGLSLGEYCAIAAAGGMSDMDAIQTVRCRGIYMEEAAPKGNGAMSAVLGLSGREVEKVLKDRSGIYVANYNCPGQVVITGEADKMPETELALKEAGAKRVLPLQVSGPFHSPMMRSAGERLKEVLGKIAICPLTIPYVANVNAELVYEHKKIEELLVQQVSHSVLWQQSVETMIQAGTDIFVEIGPGRTLTGFMRKINRNVQVYHIGNWEEAIQVCETLLGKK